MRILIYLGHPAHFHLFKNVISFLEKRGHHLQVVIKEKEVLKALLDKANCSYYEVHEEDSRGPVIDFLINLVVGELAVFKLARNFKPHVMLGTSVEIAHVGKMLGLKSIVVNEDDFDVAPWFCRLAYPFATSILAPSVCNVGQWGYKKISYEGYHELAYLHPNQFKPNDHIYSQLAPGGEQYFILRFAKLQAHYAGKRKGISAEVAKSIIECLEPHGRIYITSDRILGEQFEDYRIAIDPGMMHSALYYASLYIGDSQTMAAEAAVLGTPSICFNDFVGEFSYLEELEHRYGLTYGIHTDNPGRLLQKVGVWLRQSDLHEEWQRRRKCMLHDKIDVAQFMGELIERIGRPSSAQLVASDVNYAPHAHH